MLHCGHGSANPLRLRLTAAVLLLSTLLACLAPATAATGASDDLPLLCAYARTHRQPALLTKARSARRSATSFTRYLLPTSLGLEKPAARYVSVSRALTALVRPIRIGPHSPRSPPRA